VHSSECVHACACVRVSEIWIVKPNGGLVLHRKGKRDRRRRGGWHFGDQAIVSSRFYDQYKGKPMYRRTAYSEADFFDSGVSSLCTCV
jgi:hypothetical protein